MGYAIVAELAHELETVLDRVRRNDLAIDADVMDVLFRSADVLEQAVEAAVAGRDGEVLAADLVATLHALGVGESIAQQQGTWTRHGAARCRNARAHPPRAGHAAARRSRVHHRSSAQEARRGAGRSSRRSIEIEAEGFDTDFALRLVTTSNAAEIEATIRRAGDIADVQIGDEPSTPAPRRPSVPMAVPVEVPVPTSVSTAERRGTRSVRIDVRRLDALMNLVGELVIARGRLTQLAGELGDLSLDETVSASSRLITELRDEITASRMVPMAQVFDRFPRVVRDAARTVGKQVNFVVEGKEIELDRSMLDEIGDSIVHLLRNAIDHGLEAPDARAAAGKPADGRLVLSAARDRSAVVIRVSDDGKGIDRDRVLQRAKRDGLVDDDKNDLSEDELLRLLARPGFSTADKVTNLSGRGVGVDAVYTRVRALGGAMDIRSVPGQGTTMMLRLPLTLAIMRALLARVGDETYAIPLAHVSETIELAPDIVRTIKGREVLLTRDEVLPLLRLRELVGLPRVRARRVAIDLEHVVVIDLGDRRAGLVIDELTGQEEIVVKQYDAVRDGLPIFGGATLLSDGRPSLIVDVSSLL